MSGRRASDPEDFDGMALRRNGNGLTAALPLWARIVLVTGPTAAIALYLVYIMVGTVTADVRWAREKLEQHNTLTSQYIIESSAANATIRTNMYLICRSMAKTSEDRQECQR